MSEDEIGKNKLVINGVFTDLIKLLNTMNNDDHLKSEISDISEILVKTIKNKKKAHTKYELLIFNNLIILRRQ